MSKSIMIIGAGPGIGQAVAKKFGGVGWTVVLTGRNPERLAALAAELSAAGIAVHKVPSDATKPVALRAAIAEAERLTRRAFVRRCDTSTQTATPWSRSSTRAGSRANGKPYENTMPGS